VFITYGMYNTGMKKTSTRSHDRAKDQTVITFSAPKALKKSLMRYAEENDLDVSKAVRKILREKGPEYGITMKEHGENDD